MVPALVLSVVKSQPCLLKNSHFVARIDSEFESDWDTALSVWVLTINGQFADLVGDWPECYFTTLEQ